MTQNFSLRILFYTKIIFLFFCVYSFSSCLVYAQDLSFYYDSALVYKHKDLEIHDFYVKKLISASKTQKNDTFLLKAYQMKASIFYETAITDSAFLYIQKTIDLSEKTKNDEARIDVLRLKSYVYKNRVYDKDSALFYLELVLKESKEINYKYGEIKGLEGISFLLMDKGKYLDATQLLLEARTIAYQIKDEKALCSINNNIGHTYLQMYMHEKALSFFEEANRYREDKTTASVIPLNIAHCYYRAGNYKKALVILDKNAPLALKTSLNMAIDYNLVYINLFLDINQPQKALEKAELLDSLIIASQSASHNNLLLMKAKIYLQLKDTLTAHNYILQAEKKIDPTKNDDFKNRVLMHELFAQTYSFLKQYQKANYHSQKYISLYTTTYNKNLEQDIYESEVNQRMLLQEKENELEKIKYATELEREHQNRTYLLLILTFLIIIFIVIVRAYWINKKSSIELQNTNHKLSESQVEVLQQNHTLHEQSEELIRQSEELKSSHEELIAMNDNLECIVNQRSQELLEKNNMLEEYAFINAHKLRAPVARLLGLMQIIDISKNTDEIEFYLQLCNQEIIDLDRIVWAIKEAIEEKTPLDRWELEKRKEMK